MPGQKKISPLAIAGFHLIKWLALIVPVSAIIGSAVAFFLWLLDQATSLRWQNPWLLFLLPPGGVLIYFLYKLWGSNSEKGNNLLISEIHEPGNGIPRRMAPLILMSTVVTHFFGGSAGREGTAVQMAGSIASYFGKWLKLDKNDIRVLLIAGIAAGFGAVFGTPLTGAIFAMEVLAIGRIQYDSLLPCLIAGIAGDIACKSWGIHHTQYAILFREQVSNYLLPVNIILLGKVVLAGACFGLASFLFSVSVHGLKTGFNKLISIKWLIPVTGALLIIFLTYAVGTRDYLGLGVTTPGNQGISILSAFRYNGATHWSWLWKIIFTAITLSAGFKGGEVTPLFFIGATLGNTLASLLGAPADLFAGLGFIAVFAGATNTPVACTVMGIELFGGEHTVYFALACFTAYFFSGHSGIYTSQRIAVPKMENTFLSSDISIEDAIGRRKKTIFQLLEKISHKIRKRKL